MERRPDDVARPWVLEEGGPADALAGAATWVAHVRERCCVNRPLWSGLAGRELRGQACLQAKQNPLGIEGGMRVGASAGLSPEENVPTSVPCRAQHRPCGGRGDWGSQASVRHLGQYGERGQPHGQHRRAGPHPGEGWGPPGGPQAVPHGLGGRPPAGPWNPKCVSSPQHLGQSSSPLSPLLAAEGIEGSRLSRSAKDPTRIRSRTQRLYGRGRGTGPAAWSPQHSGPISGEPGKATGPRDGAPNSQGAWPEAQRFFFSSLSFASWHL